VTTCGENLLVGACGQTLWGVSPTIPRGEVYLVEPSTGKVLQTFRNPATAGGSNFGGSIEARGNRVLIGLSQDCAACLFDASTGKLLQTFRRPRPKTTVSSRWSHRVAFVGDAVLVGAFHDDTYAEEAGAVHLLDGSSGNLLRTIDSPT
jgi:hypothetical protein